MVVIFVLLIIYQMLWVLGDQTSEKLVQGNPSRLSRSLKLNGAISIEAAAFLPKPNDNDNLVNTSDGQGRAQQPPGSDNIYNTSDGQGRAQQPPGSDNIYDTSDGQGMVQQQPDGDKIFNTSDGQGRAQQPADSDNIYNTSDGQGRVRQQPGKALFTIEVFVILDFSVYKKWSDIYGNSAIGYLKPYYAHIINGVRERYEGIQMPEVRYSASLAGIYIADTPAKSDFIENAKTTKNSVDSKNILQVLEKWVGKMKGGFPQFDVAAVFTTYEITPGFNGFAFVGAACTGKAVSITRDIGSFETIYTITHEIGHNLGAQHDGEGNRCKYDDQYVMASSRAGPIKVDNLNTFSSCTIEYFQNYNYYLNSNRIMCYTNVPEYIFPKDIDTYFNDQPGQELTLDEQCKTIFGKDYTFYEWGGVDQSKCMRMRCIGSDDMWYESQAADTTSCGKKEWCYGGKCIKDKNAP